MVLEGQSKTDLQSLSIETTTFRVDGRNWTVYSELVLTMFLWGLAWPVGRLLATDLPPVSIAALRYAIVVPVLFGILKIKGQPIRLERKWIANLVIMGLFSTTLYQIFFLYGVRYAAASDHGIVRSQRTLDKDQGSGLHLRTGRYRRYLSPLSEHCCSEQTTRDKSRLRRSSRLCHLHRYFEKVCGSKQSRQYESTTLIPSDPRMDLSVWLDLSNSLIAVGGTLDLRLESSLVAWNSLPRPPLNRSRILLLCRRRLQDWSWESCDLRQLGPSVRRDNFCAPSSGKPQPLAWSQLPTDSGRRGTCQQTEEDGADETAIVPNWIR